MSTFREIALAKVEEGIADLQSRGEICDGHGVLAGAMVDAATIAVQDWLRQGAALLDQSDSSWRMVDGLIRAAGRIDP